MDVLQRMGPRTVPRTAVAPLELCALADTGNAAILRRRFRAWVDPLADLDTADDLALAVRDALGDGLRAGEGLDRRVVSVQRKTLDCGVDGAPNPGAGSAEGPGLGLVRALGMVVFRRFGLLCLDGRRAGIALT